MTDIRAVLDELRELHENAQIPPWQAVADCDGKNWQVCSCGQTDDGKRWTVTTDGVRCSEYSGDAETDAKLIVAMRNALPNLLAVVEAAEEARIETVRGGLTEHCPQWEAMARALDALKGAMS